MAKEIENKVCGECDSMYKLVYDLTETSGYQKFCPFCGGETNTEEPSYDEDDED
jgi:rRNA maturation endonuclease Nob1